MVEEGAAAAEAFQGLNTAAHAVVIAVIVDSPPTKTYIAQLNKGSSESVVSYTFSGNGLGGNVVSATTAAKSPAVVSFDSQENKGDVKTPGSSWVLFKGLPLADWCVDLSVGKSPHAVSIVGASAHSIPSEVASGQGVRICLDECFMPAANTASSSCSCSASTGNCEGAAASPGDAPTSISDNDAEDHAKKWNDGWQRAKAERDAPIIVNIVAAICVILIIGVLCSCGGGGAAG